MTQCLKKNRNRTIQRMTETYEVLLEVTRDYDEKLIALLQYLKEYLSNFEINKQFLKSVQFLVITKTFFSNLE